VGSPEAWWVIVVPVAVLLVRAGARRRAAFLVVTVGGSWLLNHILKSAVSRARPHFSDSFATATGSSFPSGHAQAVTAVVGALLVAGWPWIARRLRAVAVAVGVLVVALVCFSRLALGVHYLSDVVAAAIVALAWLALMTAAFSVWQDEARGARSRQPA
jgi:undecaprenyl-diphosphatase